MRLFLYVLLFGIYFTVSGQSVQKQTPEIQVQLNAYYDALERADPQKALNALNQLIILDPEFPHYYGARASVLENMNDIPIDSILSDLNKAIQLDSANSIWRIHRLDLLLSAETDGMRYQAMEDIRSMIDRDTIDIDYYLAYLNYAAICDTTSIPSIHAQAIELAFQQLTAQPNEASKWYQLAQVYAAVPAAIDAEKLMQIISAIDKAIELDPANQQYYIFRGDIRSMYTTDYQLAAADYDAASKLSSSSKLYQHWAMTLIKSENKAEAKRIIQTGLLLYPGNYALQALRKQL